LSVPDRNATPLRFMWRTDTAGRFSAVSPDFAAAMGLPVGDLLGRSFRQVSERLGLDPSGEVAALLERRDTWSGRSVLWPVAGTPLKVPVDLAALPIYARDRSFEGFRGFGVARLADAVVGAEAAPAGLAETADEQAAADLPAAANDAAAPHADDPFRGEVPALKIVPTRETPYPDKVIRLAEHRPGPPEPGLSPGERSAFREIGERLRKVEGQAGDDDSTETGEAPVAPKTDAVGTAETLDAPEAVGRADVAAGVDDEAVRPEPAEAEPSASAMLPVSAQPAEAGAEDAEADVAPTPADEAEPLPSEMPALDDPALAPASEQDAVAGAPQTPPETSDLDHWIAPSPTEAEGDADTVGWAETDGATEANGAATADEAETIGADAMHAAETEEADAVGFHFASVPDLPAMDDVAGPSQPAEATISVGPDGEDGDTLAPPADMLAPDAALPDPAGRSHMDLSDEAAQDTTGPSPQEGGERLDADAIQDGSAASGDAAELPSPLSGGVRGGGTPSGAIALPSLADMADGDPADALPADVTLPADAAPAPRQGAGFSEAPILARLPVPVLIHSGDVLHYANPEFLALTGHATLDDLAAAGGLGSLFPDPDGQLLPDAADRSLRMRAADGSEFPIEALLRSVPWEDGHALMLVVRRGDEPAMPAAPSADAARDELRAHLAELRTIIDTATDGVIIIGADGLIRSVSRPAEALFGYESDDVAGKPFVSLFAMESQRAARDYLAGLSDHGVASVLNDGREVIGREAQGRFIPLFLSIGRLPNDGGFCAVVRDITPWKRAEEELTQSRALAERASSQKSEFLARISHEIRTPLNAIIGFSELMIDERFGPVGNERYRDYLRDINKSGNHVLDLVNDLLDISKIEAGEQEMAYEAVSLNDALAQTVAMMQPQANRERVIIRSSFASRLPDVVADLRSVRQIALNLLSNAVRYTQAGGQVIVSTAYEPSGDVVIRVRDTGVGMTSAEIEQAMKPFKQVNALRGGRNDGTGLGLPLTKAMVEANRARFTISSTPGEGTLVEVTFPSTRVLAE
jgi:PAS domain S-box-containing protein